MGIATREPPLQEVERAAVRRAIFLHQDGVMLATSLAGMDGVGILTTTFSGEASVAELLPGVRDSGFGYLRVGLRCLASQGWLDLELTTDPRTTTVGVTDAGRAVAPYLDRYLDAARFLTRFSDPAADAWSRSWDATCRASFELLVDRARGGWNLGEDLGGQREVVAAHLDAAAIVPAMLHLHAGNRLDDRGPTLPDASFGGAMADLLIHLGWLQEGGGRWTRSGARARVSSQHYGLVGSYLPLLSRLEELYRGECTVESSLEAAGAEWHVHRRLNVIASGAAHAGYFADAEQVLADVFNREPVELQPSFVADMGCGDGSWLVRIHELVRERTLRGRLDTDPLLMVGFDCNPEALKEAETVLGRAGIPALLLVGDVTDPERVRESLAGHGLAIEDGLHVRAFIDHDRDYVAADPRIPATGWSTGAYVDAGGRALEGADVERNLVEHMRRWAPHVRRHGLVLLEAHSVPPQVARHHVGALHSIAFEGYHGYSHQYPIEYAPYIESCRRAGLQPANRERHYPSSRPFVAVSLNHFVAGEPDAPLPACDDPSALRDDTWRPAPGTDLEDGRGLHQLLFTDGDLLRPRTWCAAPTGALVAGALEAIESRLANARGGDVIRLLDYGTGTGLAAIELLKACKARGLEQRLERRGVALELHLADLPSSWFAQGYELLAGCALTRFHSLRGLDGRFRPLLEVTGGKRMDVIIASMVFHLIPPQVLPGLAAELASTLTEDGRLLWSSPDLGPPGPYAVLFHDPNRALRRRWVELFSEDRADLVPAGLRQPLLKARRALGPEGMAEAGARADRRVLPVANSAEAVTAALAEHLTGGADTGTYEMLHDDFVDALLVPSNQQEFLSEVGDRKAREEIALRLLRDEVLPEMERGAAGTALGLNVHWTLGGYRRPSVTPVS